MAPFWPNFLAHTGTSRLDHWQPGIARHTPRTGTGNERRARAACGTRRARAPVTCGAPPHAPAYVVRIGHRGSEQDQRRNCACHIRAGDVRARSASGSAGDWFWVCRWRAGAGGVWVRGATGFFCARPHKAYAQRIGRSGAADLLRTRVFDPVGHTHRLLREGIDDCYTTGRSGTSTWPGGMDARTADVPEWTGEALVHADGHEECGSGRGMERPAGVRPVHPGTSARLEFPGYIPCVPQHTAK